MSAKQGNKSNAGPRKLGGAKLARKRAWVEKQLATGQPVSEADFVQAGMEPIRAEKPVAAPVSGAAKHAGRAAQHEAITDLEGDKLLVAVTFLKVFGEISPGMGQSRFGTARSMTAKKLGKKVSEADIKSALEVVKQALADTFDSRAAKPTPKRQPEPTTSAPAQVPTPIKAPKPNQVFGHKAVA